MKTVSRYLPPTQEFLPATNCRRTGRIMMDGDLPKSEWECPNHYPDLPLHPVYNNYMWWQYGLGEDLRLLGRQRREYVTSTLGPYPGRFTLPDIAGVSMFSIGIIAGAAGLVYYLIKKRKR